MGKIIILLIIGGAIYYLLKSSKPLKENKSDEEEFVQCENCKTFVLKKYTTEKNGKYYCKECNADS